MRCFAIRKIAQAVREQAHRLAPACEGQTRVDDHRNLQSTTLGVARRAIEGPGSNTLLARLDAEDEQRMDRAGNRANGS